MVRELSRTGHGWRLTVGSAAAPEYIDADAVIIAIPARPAGRLLAEVPGVSAAVTAFGRDQLREHGDHHARLPPIRLSCPGLSARAGAGTWSRPWTGGPSRRPRSPPSSGRTWPEEPPGRTNRWKSCDAPSAASARKRCCSEPTTSSPRWPSPSSRKRPGPGRSRRDSCHPLGRGATAIHGRPPGPGGEHPGLGRHPAWARGLRRGLRRSGHTRVYQDRSRGGRPDPGFPAAAGRPGRPGPPGRNPVWRGERGHRQ